MKAALTLAASLLTALPAMAQDQMTLVLDWFVNPNHGPIIVAQEQGYFAEENLEVEVIAPADPSAPPKMAAAGKADLAISYQPQLHLQVAEGLPLKRVGTLVASPLNCLLVLEDGPIDTMADLKGRKVGFSVAGVEEALLSALLTDAGLTLDDIELDQRQLVALALTDVRPSGRRHRGLSQFRAQPDGTGRGRRPLYVHRGNGRAQL